jgi:hypothetical protein
MTRHDLLDGIRRHCLQHLGGLLSSVDMDAGTRERVHDELIGLLDALLVDVERSDFLRPVAEHVFVRVWPRLLARMAPAVVALHGGDRRAGMRLQAAVEAAGRMHA